MSSKKGYTLIELMVVTTIFAVLALLVSASILYSVRSTGKSESLSNVRAEHDNTILVMERHLRNADNITTTLSGDTHTITFTDYLENDGYLICDTSIGVGRIASKADNFGDTYYLTSDKVFVSECDFNLIEGTYGTPDKIELKITAEAKGVTGVETGSVVIETILNLRNY